MYIYIYIYVYIHTCNIHVYHTVAHKCMQLLSCRDLPAPAGHEVPTVPYSGSAYIMHL